MTLQDPRVNQDVLVLLVFLEYLVLKVRTGLF